MTLALIDDDEDVRRALARLLRVMGHEVAVFESAEAYERAAVSVDCLIVDVRMPGTSGLELRDRLRQRPASPPVVLITGDSDRFARDLPEAAGTPSIIKPFDDRSLMAAIADAVSPAKATPARHER